MKKDQFLAKYGFHLASLCAVIALVLVIFAATADPVLGIVLSIIALLFMIGGGVILYLGYRAKTDLTPRSEQKAENAGAQQSEEEEDLSFADVLAGIEEYFGEDLRDIPALWQEIPRSLRARLEEQPVFRPLLAFRMFWELSCKQDNEIAAQFADADAKAIGYLCGALCEADLEELADRIYELKTKAAGESARIATFFRKCRSFLEEQMVLYVEAHMEEFGSDE